MVNVAGPPKRQLCKSWGCRCRQLQGEVGMTGTMRISWESHSMGSWVCGVHVRMEIDVEGLPTGMDKIMQDSCGNEDARYCDAAVATPPVEEKISNPVPKTMITKSRTAASIFGNYQWYVFVKCALMSVPAVMEWGKNFLQGWAGMDAFCVPWSVLCECILSLVSRRCCWCNRCILSINRLPSHAAAFYLCTSFCRGMIVKLDMHACSRYWRPNRMAKDFTT